MLRSMTAFARKTADTEYGALCWEVRSLNHRYLESQLRSPEEFKALETAIRESISQYINRGKVESSLRLTPNTAQGSNLQINQGALAALIKNCNEII